MPTLYIIRGAFYNIDFYSNVSKRAMCITTTPQDGGPYTYPCEKQAQNGQDIFCLRYVILCTGGNHDSHSRERLACQPDLGVAGHGVCAHQPACRLRLFYQELVAFARLRCNHWRACLSHPCLHGTLWHKRPRRLFVGKGSRRWAYPVVYLFDPLTPAPCTA